MVTSTLRKEQRPGSPRNGFRTPQQVTVAVQHSAAEATEQHPEFRDGAGSQVAKQEPDHCAPSPHSSRTTRGSHLGAVSSALLSRQRPE